MKERKRGSFSETPSTCSVQ